MSARVVMQNAGQRLDHFCAEVFDSLSRERIKSLIHNGDIAVQGIDSIKPSLKVEEGWQVSCFIPETSEADPLPEDIPLDILYEDDDLIVLNKPVGMVVHPAAGNWSGTLVNALLYHCGDTLSGIGGVRRPGIIHRLDKDTSGAMIVAKNDMAHAHLSNQLSDRSITRLYLALVWDVPIPPIGTINLPIGRDHKNRLKQAIKRGGQQAREAITHYKVIKTYQDAMALVECRLETGRTHQIRVHMQAKGHPLVGDPLYGAQKSLQLSRLAKLDESIDKKLLLELSHQALHAYKISFIHPRDAREMVFEAELPKNMKKPLAFT